MVRFLVAWVVTRFKKRCGGIILCIILEYSKDDK